jgi:hypothetical protein
MFGLAMGIEAFYQRHWWLVMGLIGSSFSLVINQVRPEQRQASSSVRDLTLEGS